MRVRRNVWRRANSRRGAASGSSSRRGASTLDYVLVAGALLPIVGLTIRWGGRIITLTYEMLCVMASWPLM